MLTPQFSIYKTLLLCTQGISTWDGWGNATRCWNGVKVLLCHSYPFRLVLRISSLHVLVNFFNWLGIALGLYSQCSYVRKHSYRAAKLNHLDRSVLLVTHSVP